jgi:hypothetical protein
LTGLIKLLALAIALLLAAATPAHALSNWYIRPTVPAKPTAPWVWLSL